MLIGAAGDDGRFVPNRGMIDNLGFLGGGVIDGNGDGIWWQVLAVAFRRHWAVGKSWRWTAYHRCSSRDATL